MLTRLTIFPAPTHTLMSIYRSLIALSLRWPEPIYMRFGYVFDLRFLELKIQPISMISGIPN